MQALADQYAKRGLQVIGVTRLSKGKTMADLDEFMKTAGASFPIAYDENSTLFGALGVGPIPDMAVVKNGQVVFKDHPRRLDTATLESFLP